MRSLDYDSRFVRVEVVRTQKSREFLQHPAFSFWGVLGANGLARLVLSRDGKPHADVNVIGVVQHVFVGFVDFFHLHIAPLIC